MNSLINHLFSLEKALRSNCSKDVWHSRRFWYHNLAYSNVVSTLCFTFLLLLLVPVFCVFCLCAGITLLTVRFHEIILLSCNLWILYMYAPFLMLSSIFTMLTFPCIIPAITDKLQMLVHNSLGITFLVFCNELKFLSKVPHLYRLKVFPPSNSD